jgi:UPF0755 protein
MTHVDHVAQDRAVYRRRRITVGLIAGLVVLMLVVGALALRSVVSGPDDYSGAGTGAVEVTIPPGASATRIGVLLEEADVVATSGAFVDEAQRRPESRSIAPGTYALRLQMSAAAALDRLLDPEARVQDVVVVPEGSTVDEIVEAAVAATSIPRADLEALVRDPSPLPLPDYAQNRLEGFLFPATYPVDPGTSALQLFTAMVERFDQAAAEVRLEERAPDVGLDPYEVVVAASLVEAEVDPRDFGKAARVVLNRLEAGMRLQFDSTVNYALRSSDLQLSAEQLDVDSPFNTYRVTGLPPTPIGSPSEAALDAVLDPEQGNWVYFVTTDPASGTTKFTASYDEFLRFKAEFQATQR